MDPDLGGPKTCGSGSGSGSPTHCAVLIKSVCFARLGRTGLHLAAGSGQVPMVVSLLEAAPAAASQTDLR
jgi:hypothetical protein